MLRLVHGLHEGANHIVVKILRCLLERWPDVMLFVQCLDESKAPMLDMRKKECQEWLEDYKECLHREKHVSCNFI